MAAQIIAYKCMYCNKLFEDEVESTNLESVCIHSPTHIHKCIDFGMLEGEFNHGKVRN